MSDETLLLHPPVPFKFVRVVWLDAYSCDEWENIDAKATLEEHPCITVGWLIGETKIYLEVASTIAPDMSNPEKWEKAASMSIPKKMILEMAEPAG